MVVVEDGTHAVQAAAVCGCQKADSGTAPNVSYFLFIVYAGREQVCRWADEGQRDDFYKQLVDAMQKV